MLETGKTDEKGSWRSGTYPVKEEQEGAAGEARWRRPLMAKEACGGRDFTVVTMGIHKEKWKRKKNIEKERTGGTEAAGNEKRGRRKEKRKTNELGVGWFWWAKQNKLEMTLLPLGIKRSADAFVKFFLHLRYLIDKMVDPLSCFPRQSNCSGPHDTRGRVI